MHRQIHIDALKLIGSQLIVLHHLSAYGPVADALSEAAPGLMRWFYDYARMAVQIFLVLAGYLAVQGLSKTLLQGPHVLLPTLLRRYRRLVWPFLVAMGLAIVCAALARYGLSADFIPAAPDGPQLLAHALLLHGLLGAEALSAGVWYVAIDFQLFVLLAILLRSGQISRQPWLARGLVLACMAWSLFVFNRDAAWDNWAIYFFGAYGLGVAAHWAATAPRPWVWLIALAVLSLLALLLEYRTRIALATLVALLLGWVAWRQAAVQSRPLVPEALARWVQSLGRSSYALFLVHFPLLLLGNAVYAQLGWTGPLAAFSVLLTIWAGSIWLAWWFERWVEAPLTR